MSLTFKQLRMANRTRCEGAFHPIEEWSPTDWACAAAGEMGELCNMIKKERRGEHADRLAMAHEIADTVIYLDLLAERLGIDLGVAVREKFNIVSERVGSKVRL